MNTSEHKISEHKEDPPPDPIKGINAILEKARTSGTNKLGLLLALIELAPRAIDGNGSLSRYEIAERHMAIHWGHARPYWNVQLRQIGSNPPSKSASHTADIIVKNQIDELRKALEDKGFGDLRDETLGVVRSRVGHLRWWQVSWNAAIKTLGQGLWDNPIRRLQNLKEFPDPFLYEIFSKEIRLLPGVAKKLTDYSGIIRPAVELKFAEKVAGYNADALRSLTKYQIHEHLFGRDRFLLPQSIGAPPPANNPLDGRLERFSNLEPQFDAFDS